MPFQLPKTFRSPAVNPLAATPVASHVNFPEVNLAKVSPSFRYLTRCPRFFGDVNPLWGKKHRKKTDVFVDRVSYIYICHIYIYVCIYTLIEKYMANRPDVLVEHWAPGPNLPFWGVESHVF